VHRKPGKILLTRVREITEANAVVTKCWGYEKSWEEYGSATNHNQPNTSHTSTAATGSFFVYV